MTSNDDRIGGCREMGLVARTLNDPSATYNVLSIHDQTGLLLSKMESDGKLTSDNIVTPNTVTCKDMAANAAAGVGGWEMYQGS